ncbi:MAG TPA: multicopper oxidase family protein [Polyangiaceae bacterium]|nr:multicopper oxidase family protein [Polyangiaceae bacterium]
MRLAWSLAAPAIMLFAASCGTVDQTSPTAGQDAAAAAGIDAASAHHSAPEAATGAEAAKPGQPADWDTEFRIPDAADANPDPNIVEVTIEARLQMLTILPSGAEGGPPPQTEMWTYNGGVPGPTIRTKKGDRLIVHFKNSLPEATTVHWHGVRLPNAMDGSTMVQAPIAPGGTFDYDFVVPDAGTYWYHPHIDSSVQVAFGLYGVLVVEDPSEPPLGDELLIVLSDAGINPDGSLMDGAISGWFGDYFGREGNVELVNGKSRPKLKMRAGMPQRWRVLDASRAAFQLFDVAGVALTRIGGDDGLSSGPYPVTRAELTPGEREEIFAVATAPPGSTITAMHEFADRFHTGVSMPGVPLFDIEVTADPQWTGGPVLPTKLASIAPIDVSNATTREITFDDVLEASDAGVDGGLDYLGINGKSSTDMTKMTSVHVKVGTTEIWNVTNHTSQDHPFHMHGYQFQVLAVGGTPPPVLEWRDNVKVPAQEKLELAVNFDSRPGMWMFHCHILDHAEMGMMAMLVVDP